MVSIDDDPDGPPSLVDVSTYDFEGKKEQISLQDLSETKSSRVPLTIITGMIPTEMTSRVI